MLIDKDCKRSEEGVEYLGEVSMASSGDECQPWKSIVNTSDIRFTFPDRNIEDAANFCRNPDDKKGPWCYTDTSGSKWDYCDIIWCGRYNVRDGKVFKIRLGQSMVEGRKYTTEDTVADFYTLFSCLSGAPCSIFSTLNQRLSKPDIKNLTISFKIY